MSLVSNKGSRPDFIAVFMPLLIVILSAPQMYTVSLMSLRQHKKPNQYTASIGKMLYSN